jgi:cysteine-rich repeat protein
MQRKLVVAIGLAVFVCAGSPAHGGVDLAAACKEAKAKATGRKAADLLEAHGKNRKRPNPPKLVSDVSKAQSKFTRAFSGAEAKGRCATVGDAGAVEAKVDAFLTDAIGELCPVCGDGILAPGEECDDGNTQDNDCCSPACVAIDRPCCGRIGCSKRMPNEPLAKLLNPRCQKVTNIQRRRPAKWALGARSEGSSQRFRRSRSPESAFGDG